MTIGPLQIILLKLEDESRTLPVSQELKATRQRASSGWSICFI